MTPPLIPRLDALPEAQRRLWPMLQPLAGLDSCSIGGQPSRFGLATGNPWTSISSPTSRLIRTRYDRV